VISTLPYKPIVLEPEGHVILKCDTDLSDAYKLLIAGDCRPPAAGHVPVA
jgi:hypothetical protein